MTSLQELLGHRGVLLALVWRELKARYRGSMLGFLWTFLNPLLLMVIYSLVFSVYMRMDLPKYPIFLFTGLLPWIWFSSAMLSGATSIVDGASLIKRVAFPPQLLPTVAVTATLVNLLLALPLLFAFIALSGLSLGWSLLVLPVLIAIQYAFTLGLVLVLSIFTVRYRDLHLLLANFLTLWFFLTPVIYPLDIVPAAFRPLLVINPMVPVVVGYQDVLYRAHLPALGSLAVAAAVALVALGVGLSVCDRLRWGLVEQI